VGDRRQIEALPLPEREFESVAISPDGKQAAVQIQDSVVDIWLYDFERHGLAPLAKSDVSSQAPLWTHDGKSIIYRGTRSGYRNIFRRSADGAGAEERLTTKEKVIQTPTSVTPDGEWCCSARSRCGGSKVRSGACASTAITNWSRCRERRTQRPNFPTASGWR
jgi:Tol biopolymer transport system component